MKFYLETASLAEFSARFDADLALGISGLGGAGTANDTRIAWNEWTLFRPAGFGLKIKDVTFKYKIFAI